jgi:diacylglycerol kinase family enzyme
MNVQTVRTKFFCREVTVHNESPTSGAVVKLAAVNNSHPSHENRQSGVSTASTQDGGLTLYISNPQTRAFFVAGAEYYLDFTPAPPTASC